MNWNQSGMPAALVGNLRQRREITEFKTVLNEAQNQVMWPVDVELMAEELAKSGGREFVEMVRELTTALAAAKAELEDANRRYERLTADLRRRGVSIAERDSSRPEPEKPGGEATGKTPRREPKSILDGIDEWEEWDRRFRSLLG